MVPLGLFIENVWFRGSGFERVHLHPVCGAQLHPDGPVQAQAPRGWQDVHLPQPGYVPGGIFGVKRHVYLYEESTKVFGKLLPYYRYQSRELLLFLYRGILLCTLQIPVDFY